MHDNEYSLQLSDPRWKEKRAKILARDNHRCVACGSPHKKDNFLHVHHLVYYRKPWDVRDDSLITLCASCHRREEHIRKVDVSLNLLSRETKIPAVMLHDIIIDMTALNMDNFENFRQHINDFFYNGKKRPYRLSL